MRVRATVLVDRDRTYVSIDGRTYEVPHDDEGRDGPGAAGTESAALSPMTGVLAALHVAPGDEVASGAPLFVVEAMKMEYVVRAPRDGVVEAVAGEVGGQVALGQEIVTFATEADA